MIEWLQFGGAVIVGVAGTLGSIKVSAIAARTAQEVKTVDAGTAKEALAETVNTNLLKALNERMTQQETTITRMSEAQVKRDQSHDERVAKLETRIDAAESEVREVRSSNMMLTAFIYKLLVVVRRHELTDEIDPDDVPEGILL